MRQRYARASETPVAQLTSGVTVLAGLFVAASAWITGFAGVPGLMMSNLITGLAVAVIGLAVATVYERTYRISWLCPLLGVWAIVSVFVVSGSVLTLPSVLSNVIGGGIVVLAGLGALAPMVLPSKNA